MIELYPTVVRTSVGGLANLCWQTAGVVTPLVGGALLQEKGNDARGLTMVWLYAAIFAMGLLAPILVNTDTTHKSLEDTLLEASDTADGTPRKTS